MSPSIGPDHANLQVDVIEFKKVMATSIERALDENPELTKKIIALELGATSADLSHWLSDRTSFTLPGHLIPQFCRVVGDNSLIWHIVSTHEKAGKRLPA